jgi:hypothetical protein
MASMTLYCTKCSLHFDKNIIFDMHLSNVHKETTDIKKEPTCVTLKEKPDNTRSATVQEKKKPFKCDMCGYNFSEKGELEEAYILHQFMRKRNLSNVTCATTAFLERTT